MRDANDLARQAIAISRAAAQVRERTGAPNPYSSTPSRSDEGDKQSSGRGGKGDDRCYVANIIDAKGCSIAISYPAGSGDKAFRDAETHGGRVESIVHGRSDGQARTWDGAPNGYRSGKK